MTWESQSAFLKITLKREPSSPPQPRALAWSNRRRRFISEHELPIGNLQRKALRIWSWEFLERERASSKTDFFFKEVEQRAALSSTSVLRGISVHWNQLIMVIKGNNLPDSWEVILHPGTFQALSSVESWVE